METIALNETQQHQLREMRRQIEALTECQRWYVKAILDQHVKTGTYDLDLDNGILKQTSPEG